MPGLRGITAPASPPTSAKISGERRMEVVPADLASVVFSR